MNKNMLGFKFLRHPIAISLGTSYIYSGEVFYVMNKEDIVSSKIYPRVIPKYTIAGRKVSVKSMNSFTPNYQLYWYFNDKSDAEFLKRWMEMKGISGLKMREMMSRF
jgi:hypothetical protein